jgi:RNA polymerase sigma-70 factor (ECF subfamily)
VTNALNAGDISPDLVSRARNGDPGALRTLVTRAYPVVRRWALVRTGDPTEADDLTQDVLVQMIRRLDAWKGSGRFTTWLYTVTRNAAADRFRKRRRREAREDDVRALPETLGDPPPSPDAGADRSHIRTVLASFFEELPPRQREVFDLSELQGMSTGDIAALLGVEPVSVRAHLFKARRTLRARIMALHPELAEEWS